MKGRSLWIVTTTGLVRLHSLSASIDLVCLVLNTFESIIFGRSDGTLIVSHYDSSNIDGKT